MYSLSPTTVMNRPLGKWSWDVANMSVEPVSLVGREKAAVCERGGWRERDSSQRGHRWVHAGWFVY